MRVISGIYKRRRFDVPHTFKARPTTDFAKENLFNVLSNNYFDFEDGVTALDLFAGTGSISIELVSRGCDRVISVEKDPQHLSFISQLSSKQRCQQPDNRFLCFLIPRTLYPCFSLQQDGVLLVLQENTFQQQC